MSQRKASSSSSSSEQKQRRPPAHPPLPPAPPTMMRQQGGSERMMTTTRSNVVGGASAIGIDRLRVPVTSIRGTTTRTSNDNDNRLAGTEPVVEQESNHTIRMRPLARLDRLLRRWLPGYALLRNLVTGGSSSSSANNNVDESTANRRTHAAAGGNQTEMTMASGGNNALAQQQQGAGVRLESYASAVDPTLVVRKRHDGEVYLDTGIAKSEFCLKLEKLLRAKLVEKE